MPVILGSFQAGKILQDPTRSYKMASAPNQSEIQTLSSFKWILLAGTIFFGKHSGAYKVQLSTSIFITWSGLSTDILMPLKISKVRWIGKVNKSGDSYAIPHVANPSRVKSTE